MLFKGMFLNVKIYFLKYIFVAISIISLLFIIFYIKKLNFNYAKTFFTKKASISKMNGPEREINSIPIFSTYDVYGNLINTDTFKGKYSFIQFINPKKTDQIEFFKIICSEYKNKELSILGFIADYPLFLDKIGNILPNTWIVARDYESLKTIFRVSPCCESFFLFNKHGSLVKTDFNWKGYKGSVKIYLKTLIENEYFSLDLFIKENEYIGNIEWFSPLWKTIKDEKIYKYYVISMFSRPCMNCTSGWMINKLNELYSRLNGHSIYFLTLLSDNFSENDLSNFISNMKVNYSVFKADKVLSKKWNELKEKFNELAVSS